jgi:hypothetical protein
MCSNFSKKYKVTRNICAMLLCILPINQLISQESSFKKPSFHTTLDDHNEIASLKYEENTFIGVSFNMDKSIIGFFYGSNRSNEIKGYFSKIYDLYISDRVVIKNLFKNNFPIDIALYDHRIILLYFDKVVSYNRAGQFMDSMSLSGNFMKFHTASNRLFLSKSYKFNGDSALTVIELIKSRSPKKLFEEVEVYRNHSWPYSPLCHFMNKWIEFSNDKFYLCDPIDFVIKGYNLQGDLLKKSTLPLNAKMANYTEIDSIYYAIPVSSRKKAIIELTNYLSGYDYIEKLFVFNKSLLLSIKTGEADSRILVLYDFENEKILSIDTVYFELFSQPWIDEYGEQFHYPNFPLRFDLNREIILIGNKAFTSIEFSYFPKNNSAKKDYFNGLEEYFNTRDVNFSILKYNVSLSGN